MEKKINYTQTDRVIVNLLANGAELTLAEMNEKADIDLVSGHVVSAMKKGLIEVVGEKEIVKPSKRKVAVYNFIGVPADVKLTDKEKELVKFLCGEGQEPTFTIAELSDRMGKKLTSGNINGLTKKGVIEKNDECEVSTTRKSKVKVYGWLANPTD